MKKNDLIKLLQGIEGNPEVMLWNGYVNDFMKVGGVSERDLVKMTFEHYAEMCRLKDCSDLQDWNHQHTAEDLANLQQHYKKHEWEHNPYVYKEDIAAKHYKKKRVVYINAKLRGKTMSDRLGSVSY